MAIGYVLHAQLAEPEIVTKEVPGKIPQDRLDALQAWQDELDQRQADLDQRDTELSDRESSLDDREAAISEQERTIAANTITDGIWSVGVDIEPGTYRAVNVGAECYWAVLASGTNGTEIINNGIPGGGNPTVTLAEGQDFETSSCGEWTKQ